MATKHKKRHANSSAAMRQRAEAARIADEKDRYRKLMNPIVFAVIGALLIPVALYFQFVKKDGGPKSGPRLK